MLQLIGEIIVAVFFVFGLYCAILEIWHCLLRHVEHRTTQKESAETFDNPSPNPYNK